MARDARTLRLLAGAAALVLIGSVAGATGATLAAHGKARPDTGAQGTVKMGRAGSAPLAPGAGFSSEALWSSSNDWEPNVAAAPNSSWIYELTTRYGNKFCSSGQGHCMAFRSSSDGGTTWSADSLVCPCKAAQNDPVMKVATDGTIYGVHMNGWAVVFQKSTDHGQTWSAPVDFQAMTGFSFTDKPWIAISPSGQNVYIVFNSTNSYVAVSHDYGATFSAPVQTNSDALYWFAEGGAVAPNGSVYFSESAEQNAKSPKGPIRLAVVSSANSGASWTTTFVDTSQQQPPCTVKSCPSDFFGAQIALGVDPAGTVMVAYAKSTTAAGPMSIYERTSTNGTAWSAPAALASGGTSVGADFPAVVAGPTGGDFRVGWMDDRNGASAFNVWCTSTTNSGGTWTTPTRLSNATSGAPYITSAGFAFTYGDYFSMAVDPTGKTFVIWGEGPNYTGPGGTWSTSGS